MQESPCAWATPAGGVEPIARRSGRADRAGLSAARGRSHPGQNQQPNRDLADPDDEWALEVTIPQRPEQGLHQEGQAKGEASDDGSRPSPPGSKLRNRP